MGGEAATVWQRRRRVVHAIEGQGVRFEVVVDDDPRDDERVILNTRHSIARQLTPSGKGHAWLNGTGALASFGELVFLPAHVPVHVRGRSRQLRLARIEFDDDRFSVIGKAFRAAGLAIGSFVDLQNPTIARLLQVLAMEAEAPRPASDIYFEGLSFVIAAELVRHLSEFGSLQEQRNSLPVSVDLDMVNDYVRSHLNRPIAVGEVARLYGMSERHLGRLFRAVTGQTVHAYIEQIRIGHAVKLLAHSNLSVKQVGFRVGYASQASFAVAFRRVMGSPPSACRTPHLRVAANPESA